MAAAGYSGTPLARKLSLKPGMTIWLKDMPDSVRAEIGDVGLREMVGIAPGMMAAHIFTAERAVMEDTLAHLRNAIASDGFVWISWPKKALRLHRGHDPRGRLSNGLGRRESLRGGRDLVGAEAHDPQGIAVNFPSPLALSLSKGRSSLCAQDW